VKINGWEHGFVLACGYPLCNKRWVVAKKQFMDQMQEFSEKVIIIRNQAYLIKGKASLEKKKNIKLKQ
jgi:hypothetical protein